MSGVVEEELELEASEEVSSLVAGASAATIYKFDEDFQDKIAAMCLRDTTFMQRTEGLIRPEYFESTANAALVNIANRYFSKYRKCPGDRSVIGSLIKHDVINKVVQRELAADCVRRLQDRKKEDIEAGRIKPSLFQVDISDRDYVVEQVATFARYQALSSAILKSCEHLELHNFTDVHKAIQDAMNVGENQDAGSYDYGEMLAARTEERAERAAGKLPPTGITTGYPDLDKHLYHKGWGKSELSVLMGPAKAGKSTALMEFGISAAGSIYRYNVLYVTLEVSAKIMAERADSRIGEVLMSDLDKNIATIRSAVSKWHTKAGRFIIHEAPTGSMRPSDLRRLLERYKARGITFDLVIVDYADLMSPDRHTQDTIENSKSVYVGLRGLAMMEQVAILTATQTNREGAKKTVATMTDVAEDFNKIRIADLVISINRTEEERKVNEARLYFAASRNQATGFSIRISQDIARMRFIREVLGEE